MERKKTSVASKEKPNTAPRRDGTKKTGRSVPVRAAILLLIFSLLVCSGIFTYAKFTNSLQTQRTVAAYDTLGERFSSNYLQAGEGVNVRTVTVATTLEMPMAIVTVCNYEQGRQMYFNTIDIPYSLSLRLVKYNTATGKYEAATADDFDGHDYTVTVSKNGTTVELDSDTLLDETSFSEESLSRDEASSDAYTVVFNPYQSEIYLEMVVTPAVGTLLSTLRGILKPEIRMAGASSSWAGSFQDSTANAPATYDGFNYRVSGVGSGNFTLRWDSSKVGISAVSLMTLLDIEGATMVGSSITFPVDDAVESLYDLQFYKINITSETWSNMTSSVVTFDFSE